jgi:hypothetical protein
MRRELFEDGTVMALAAPHHGAQDHDAGALREGEDGLDDLLGALLLDLPAAAGAVGDPGAGEEQAEIVVDLRHRPHGGAGVVGGPPLVDGDGRGEPLDLVHIRLLHQPQELAGVGGEGLHVASLALGVEGVEGQAGFAGAGEAGDDDELLPRDLHGDVLEVVLSGAPNDDLPLRHRRPSLP